MDFPSQQLCVYNQESVLIICNYDSSALLTRRKCFGCTL